MALQNGSRLGPYEILSPLGAGGMGEVYVSPFPAGMGRRQISTDGRTDPMWGPKGGELFYRSGNRMMVVPYTVEDDRFLPGTSRELFQGRFAYGPGSSPDIAPDGEHFLMLQRPESEEATASGPIVVLNWFDELKRLVPTN